MAIPTTGRSCQSFASRVFKCDHGKHDCDLTILTRVVQQMYFCPDCYQDLDAQEVDRLLKVYGLNPLDKAAVNFEKFQLIQELRKLQQECLSKGIHIEDFLPPKKEGESDNIEYEDMFQIFRRQYAQDVIDLLKSIKGLEKSRSELFGELMNLVDEAARARLKESIELIDLQLQSMELIVMDRSRMWKTLKMYDGAKHPGFIGTQRDRQKDRVVSMLQRKLHKLYKKSEHLLEQSTSSRPVEEAIKRTQLQLIHEQIDQLRVLLRIRVPEAKPQFEAQKSDRILN